MSLDLFKKLPHYLLPKQALTFLVGCLAKVKNPIIKNFLIKQFIAAYHVNMKEAVNEDPHSYVDFNDFFIRHLKTDCRPIASAQVISPVDGCVSEIGRIQSGQLIQAKGKEYTVQELLACDEQTAASFAQGHFATLYLSPKDYHRIHMPIDAELKSMTYVPGALFSVKPSTVNTIPKLFARNERLVVFFNTALGPMSMVLVGATIVGAIGTSWHGELQRSQKEVSFAYQDRFLKQAEEMGYFKLGSTVILLFADADKVQWNDRLTAGSPIRFGEALNKS